MTHPVTQIKVTHASLLLHCFDFSPPAGWIGIVDGLLNDISRILQGAGVQDGLFGIRQIKEKFGGLRIYVYGYPQPPSSPNMEPEWPSGTDIHSSAAPMSRNWHFEGIGSVDFDERVSTVLMARVLAAIGTAAYLPEDVALEIRARIEFACKQADCTCQLCGNAGALVIENGWHLTVCSDHRDPSARAAWWTERERQ